MNKKLMMLLGLAVVECSAGERIRVNREDLAHEDLEHDVNLLLNIIYQENNNPQPNDTLESFFNRYQPQGLRMPLDYVIDAFRDSLQSALDNRRDDDIHRVMNQDMQI